MSQYQKGETNLDCNEATDSESQWHQLGRISKSAPRSRQTTTPAPDHSVFLQAGCPSCRPTNSVKALKASERTYQFNVIQQSGSRHKNDVDAIKD